VEGGKTGGLTTGAFDTLHSTSMPSRYNYPFMPKARVKKKASKKTSANKKTSAKRTITVLVVPLAKLPKAVIRKATKID
jgi:hypothetical protein